MEQAPPRTIELQRVRLRQATVEDAESIYEYGSDPAVACYADWPCRTTIEPLVEAIKARTAAWGEGGEYSWVIATLTENRAIGGVMCSIDGDAAEIGFLLNQRFWGRGYAGEAANAVIDWLLSVPAITRIWAACDTENAASIRVLEKLQFKREQTLSQAVVRPQISPEPRDAFLYAHNQRNAPQDAAEQPVTAGESNDALESNP